MKALLIYPPFASTWLVSLGFGEPLGIAYVAAALEQSGRHQVEILDGVGTVKSLSNVEVGQINWIGVTHDEVMRRMADLEFDVIGISMSRTSAIDPLTEALIRRIKTAYPDVPVIAGGPEASHFWHRYIQNPDIDYIVIGEGEKTMVDLLDALEGRGSVADVRGIAWRGDDGKAVKTPDQDIVDIDSIPWPARHLLPLRSYIDNRPSTDVPAATILTSRACPFSCAFCSTIHIWGRKWRGRSAVDVVDEMEFLVRTYGVKEIRIQDDNFCVDRKRVHRICDLILERGLDIRLHVDPGVMSMLADRDLLTKLRRVGMVSLNMQLETGSEKTQAYVNKKIDLDHMRAMVRCSHELGMAVTTNIILGFPYETKADMEESVRTAIGIGFDNIGFNWLDPRENTRVWHDFIAAGIFGADDHIQVPVPTLYCSADEVRAMRLWAIEEFERNKSAPALGKTVILAGEDIRHEDTHCYTVRIEGSGVVADCSDLPWRSPARLYENDRLLGPAHAQHVYIRTIGDGRYSHWGSTVYFSASDNSDPRRNGRVYRLEY